ncbi:hypothetical protein PUR61_05430 [Streptomyces sp. BE20]|uniref:hypothetical protein n=1 Tax=Streptomyces sp. BE20 TaxID=3002525 RepID=UPI002E7A545A|nr:hypothetical protein [Streptomyces sp. BE20]MEE1821640.1 hypothetical protein [Streptomyces sp. BE20]
MLLHTDYFEEAQRGHLEWSIPNPRPEIVFPAVRGAVAADRSDLRFASGILVLVAAALDRAVFAAPRVADGAAVVAREAQWERERPEGTGRRDWMRAVGSGLHEV